MTAVHEIEDLDAAPEAVRSGLAQLLTTDPELGTSTALGILSRAPRIKPSSALLIDPGDTVLRRWRQRVAAAAALLSSPHVTRVFDELVDELADSSELASDVLATATVSPALPEAQRARLLALRR